VVAVGVGGHENASLALHEYGHAAGGLTGADRHPAFRVWHVEIYAGLPKYYQQGGPAGAAGMSETFAESFALYYKGGRDAIAAWAKSDVYADWFARQVTKWEGGSGTGQAG
jgi:hypothetical protein